MKCIALVIGINEYINTDIYPKLKSAVKDADDIREKLKEHIALFQKENVTVDELNKYFPKK